MLGIGNNVFFLANRVRFGSQGIRTSETVLIQIKRE